MKRAAYVDRFVRALCPEYPELYLLGATEEKMLTEAAVIIESLRAFAESVVASGELYPSLAAEAARALSPLDQDESKP